MSSQDMQCPMRTDLERGVLKCFDRLFPIEQGCDVAAPAQRYLLAMISNMASIAFEAYKSPSYFGTDLGITEKTKDGTTLVHLNEKHLEDTMEGVLKIELHGAKNVKDSDTVLQGTSDPYIVFKSGVSMVASDVINNSTNPDWNSTHYLLIRKHSFLNEGADKLEIDLYDYDTGTETGVLNSFVRRFNVDDHIGHALLDLDSFKKPGVQKHEVEVTDKRFRFSRATTVRFATEFLSVQDYCKEVGKTEKSHWLDKHIIKNEREDWATLSNETRVGHVPVTPLCFFESDASGTEAWLHIHDSSKTLILAFRGTEVGEMADLMADTDMLAEALDDIGIDQFVIKPSETLQEPNVTVHRGFLNAYKAVRETIMETLYTTTTWDDDWVILVTGHSLGGALAVLSAYELSNRSKENQEAPRVGMLSVGAPKLASRSFIARYNETVPTSFRVVNRSDAIHLLPYPYLHVDQEVVVHPNGEVEYDAESLQSGLSSSKMRELKLANGAEEITNHVSTTRQAFRDALSARYHRQDYYFELVSHAVTKVVDLAFGKK